MINPKVQVFATTADVGIRFQGEDYAELYRNAVNGLNLLYFPEGIDNNAKPAPPVQFSFHGDSPENILVNLLTEVVYLLQDHETVTVDMDIEVATETRISAMFKQVYCTSLPRLEIKSVTYHNLSIIKKNSELSAAVIFDV